MQTRRNLGRIIELAERHDAALYQARKQSKEKHRSPNPRKPQHNNASNNNNNANKPRSGNTNKGSPNKFRKYTKLAPQLREQLIKEGKCLYCRETGHQVANCPKAKKRLNNDWRKPSTAAMTVEDSDIEASAAAITPANWRL